MLYVVHVFSNLSLHLSDNLCLELKILFFGYDIASHYFKYTNVLKRFLNSNYGYFLGGRGGLL